MRPISLNALTCSRAAPGRSSSQIDQRGTVRRVDLRDATHVRLGDHVRCCARHHLEVKLLTDRRLENAWISATDIHSLHSDSIKRTISAIVPCNGE
jgi:hypothetical protein